MKINLRLKGMVGLILGGLLAWSSLFAESRTWTNADGKKIQGEQVGIDLTKQTVQIKMADGKTYNIPLAGLSKDDNTVARAWVYPPSTLITYDTKSFAGTIIQVMVRVHNSSKSTHAYSVFCVFAPATHKDSTGADVRELNFGLSQYAKLTPNDSTDRAFADDKEEGFRPPDSPNLPPNP